MLQLKNIVKQYGEGENAVKALGGVSISFRENEFVSILGHSGCGKTTLLNIIGGLDHYTSGDLVINGISTKNYKDRDWDAYRNHTIGFIFQSYNLIPHQTVLANVELALTISGVSKSERRRRAIEALEKVGLGDQIHKKPNQMSGGQMQRVAIARALINNPDILLADEPTGALDSETSIQVMELLKEIAKDKLVIMVTHNPELAEQYSTRIVRIKDGLLTDDSDPFEPEQADAPAEGKKKRVSMSFLTAISLSLNNLLTKKGRTILTAFAGSIGIIGIALILSLSTGINDYINEIQEATLSSYPIQIFEETADTAALMSAMMDNSPHNNNDNEEPSELENIVHGNTAVYEVFNSLNSSAKQKNDMAAIKKFLDSDETIAANASSVSYSYDVQMPIFTKDPTGKIIKSDFKDTFQTSVGVDVTSAANSAAMLSMTPMGNVEIWQEMLPGENDNDVNEIIKNQYDLIYGSWPKSYNEVVVILTKNNEIPDIVMYTLGFKDQDNLPEIMNAAMTGGIIDTYGVTEWTFDEVMSKEYKLILPCEYYQKNESGVGYVDLTKTDTGLDFIYSAEDIGTPLKICGFIRPNEDSSAAMLTGYIGYTKALTDYVIETTNNSDIVAEQQNDEKTDVLSGDPFKTDDYVPLSDAEKAEKAKNYIETLSTSDKADVFRFIMSQPNEADAEAYADQFLANTTREQIEDQMAGQYAEEMGVESADSVKSYIKQMSDEELFGFIRENIKEQYAQQYAAQVEQQFSAMTADQIAATLDMTPLTEEQYAKIFDEYTPEQLSDKSYDDVMDILGKADFDNPSTINIFARSFEEKDQISERISEYNDAADEEDQIHYTDYVALLMSSITDIISGISYVLIAFVAISLVVSSIMIGIITYISVLERTREIGILRAIGASKHDVSTVFNAETLLVGFTSGLIGVGVSALALFPINAIIYNLTNIEGLKAVLPIPAAVILVAISMVLTLIAGIIPSRVASKKDPVEALRTE